MNGNNTMKKQLVDISHVKEDASSHNEDNISQQTVSDTLHCDETSETKDGVPLFDINEKIYAADECGDIYLATIKKLKIISDNEKPCWKYLVHFDGWNSRHDKWASATDILPDNEESRYLAEQSKLKVKEVERKRKERKTLIDNERKRKLDRRKRVSAKVASGGTSAEGMVKKRARPTESKRLMHECASLPFSLKQVMANEQTELMNAPIDVTSEFSRRLHDLPSSITVELILKQFSKSSIKNRAESTINIDMANIELDYISFTDGMIKLFDHMLPKYLLYNFERDQYLQLCTDRRGQNASVAGKEVNVEESEPRNPSAIYNGEFLLRMIARLPYLLSAMNESASACKLQGHGKDDSNILSNWNTKYEDSSNSLSALITELIVFLQKKKDKIFKGKYF
jgi:hypothetical protein